MRTIKLLVILLVISSVLIAQKKTTHKYSKSFYYIVLTYYDYNDDRHDIFSEIGEMELDTINGDVAARLLDNFEKNSDPFRTRTYITRDIRQFKSYKDASDELHFVTTKLYMDNRASKIDNEIFKRKTK